MVVEHVMAIPLRLNRIGYSKLDCIQHFIALPLLFYVEYDGQ